MKKFLFFAFFALLCATASFAQPQFLGEFSAGWRFDQYTANGYTIDLIFCGGNKTTMSIRQLSSPENPIVPTCYFWIFKLAGAKSFIYALPNIQYTFQIGKIDNTVKAWREP